jgi:23S rRNA (pseudouridine1915-N3)-methyltransferase
VKVIPESRNTRNLSLTAYRKKEGELLWPFLEGKSDVFLLDERGEEFTSREFAGFLEKKMIAGCRELIFVIGGPYGFPESTVKISAGKISLSKLTFSHQMVRLLFAEQLYRAFTILKGEPYHHE